MKARRGKNIDAHTPPGSNATASSDKRKTKADSAAASKSAPQKTETLGVLLVHGIGSQRRGDTLVHCTTALHSWIREWLKYGDGYADKSAVDLVDTSIAEAGPDHPAQARIIFRREKNISEREIEISKISWLIVESSWFETYRRPGFYEFLRWALWVLPISAIVHFLPSFRRLGRALAATEQAQELRWLSPSGFFDVKRELGPVTAHKAYKEAQDVARRGPLLSQQAKLASRAIGIYIKLTLSMIVGLVVQLLLIVIAVLAIVPGITRSFAGWVQRKISATIGDSFLFVTSPITGAAVITRVEKDLEWLAARCDRVIILAHSQGAAVSYKVIERQFWDGHLPERLHALVTYGSGLRKLFDLEVNVQPQLSSWIAPCVRAIALALSMSALIAFFIGGMIPWWAALLGLSGGIWFQRKSWPKISLEDPEVLPVVWHDYYSSYDPVPNGPIDVVPEPTAIWNNAALASDSVVKDFNSRQREVVNRRSIFTDHTSYWSSPDDFVARVANILARASNMPICFTLDHEWLQISANRRLWRVSWLSQCRAVAGLAVLAILFWPRHILDPATSLVRELAAAVTAKLPEKLAVWLSDTALVPDWLLGVGGLALATYLIFLVALASWTVWEKQELTRFFLRKPHPPIGVAGWVFALGWLGVLILAPTYALAHAHSDWDDILAVLWAPFTLASWSAWMIRKSGRGPGTLSEWGRITLAHAEKALADKARDRTTSLQEAKFCFEMSQKYLETKHSGSEEWTRAIVGETRVIEELTQSNPLLHHKASGIYHKAIEALKLAGRDASEVQTRLNRLTAVKT